MQKVSEAIKEGLLSAHKYLPNWYRYDRNGSTLNDKCFDRQEYYMNRSEMDILQSAFSLDEMISEMPKFCVLVDLGSGNSEKTKLVINSLLKKQGSLRYYAVDISEEFLKQSCGSLETIYKDQDVEIIPLPGDYDVGLQTISAIKECKFILWLGGIQMESSDDQIKLLKKFGSYMSVDDRLYLSADITQNRKDIELAYPPYGEEREYLLNSIHRLNTDFDSEIDVNKFELQVEFVKRLGRDENSYVRGSLLSLCNQTYNLPGLGISIEFKEGERIELSHWSGYTAKYTEDQLTNRVEAGGLAVQRVWRDSERHVVILCLKTRM